MMKKLVPAADYAIDPCCWDVVAFVGRYAAIVDRVTCDKNKKLGVGRLNDGTIKIRCGVSTIATTTTTPTTIKRIVMTKMTRIALRKSFKVSNDWTINLAGSNACGKRHNFT